MESVNNNRPLHVTVHPNSPLYIRPECPRVSADLLAIIRLFYQRLSSTLSYDTQCSLLTTQSHAGNAADKVDWLIKMSYSINQASNQSINIR